jgi:hypothetical protein
MTVETHTAFASENLRIEGLFENESRDRGAVITHPHPLFGGDMHNPVVESLQKAYRRCGYATLRFDFRGTGRSQGRYDEGRGERRDVRAAVAHLIEKGVRRVDLAGYSFGAWVNALAVSEGLPVQGLVMVSPPTDFLDFTPVAALPALKLVITGSRDDIAPAERVQAFVGRWNPQAAFELIQGCDHFYSGHLLKLEEIIQRHIGR